MKKGEEDVMGLDESDSKILDMLVRSSPEFAKLDDLDQQVLFDYLTRPDLNNRVKSYVDYLGKEYTCNRLKPISNIKLYEEIMGL